MDQLVIRGGRRIEGSVQIRGAKNAALPEIAAALLSSDRLELANVPEVTDVDTMLALMREFGVEATRGSGRILVLDARGAHSAEAPYDIVRRMRASILVLAPLLARFGSARVSLPGEAARSARDRSICISRHWTHSEPRLISSPAISKLEQRTAGCVAAASY